MYLKEVVIKSKSIKLSFLVFPIIHTLYFLFAEELGRQLKHKLKHVTQKFDYNGED